MPNKRPIIGITMGHIPARQLPYGKFDVASLPLSYLDVICRNGAVPIAIPNNPVGLDQVVPMLSGLLMIGGDDLAPERYTKRQAHATNQTPATGRDETELRIVRAALRRNVPVLGICRGHQVLNVALDGSLHQHLLDGVTTRNHCQLMSTAPERQIWHDIIIEPDTRVAKIVGAPRLRVNSDHHQGIDRLGRNLKITARSTDGVIEAIEGTKWPFVMGIQWHPERITATHPEQLKFFQALIRAARRFSAA